MGPRNLQSYRRSLQLSRPLRHSLRSRRVSIGYIHPTEAFKDDTSKDQWHGPSIRDVYRFLAGKDVGAPTGPHPMHHSIAYPREGNRPRRMHIGMWAAYIAGGHL